MSRLTDAIASGGYAKNELASMLDGAYGGQQGWSPNLNEWVSNQAYVSRPIIPILLEAPKLFTVLPDSYKWVAALKSMFELHAQSWDGFNSSLKVDWDEHAVGGAGEMQQEVVNVTRERTQPKWSGTEKYGRPFQTLLDYWIRYGLMDPETKFALAGTLGDDSVEDLLADWFTASAIFIRPDPLHRKVDHAWLCVNMMPEGNGELTGKRDLTTGQELLKLDIQFSSITQTGAGVKLFAQNILDNIRTQYADPSMRPSAINRVSPDVASINRGYKQWTETVGRTAVGNMGV